MGRFVCLRAGLLTLVVSAVGTPALAAPLGGPAGGAAQGPTAGATMTNQDVVKMSAAGLPEDVIVTAIRQAAKRGFDLSPTGLIELKQAKVPDSLIRAMQAVEAEAVKGAPEPRPAVTSPPAASPPSSAPPPASTTTSPRPAATAPAPPPPPPPPPAEIVPNLREPTSLGEVVGIALSSGVPTALEPVRMLERKVGGPRSQGVFKPSTQDFSYYFEGSSSPAAFRASEPMVLAVRLLGPGGRWGKELTVAEVEKHFLLTRLQSDDGRRYITKVDIPLDVAAFGRPTPGTDNRRPERMALSFQLTPRTPLAPGDYVILMAGAEGAELIANLNAGHRRWAFSVVDR